MVKTKGERIKSNMFEIGKLLDSIRIASREIPSCQCLWLLILKSFSLEDIILLEI